MNIIKARLKSTHNTVTSHAFQWDYGQILKLEGIELPNSYEVHFSNEEQSGVTITQIGDANGVAIPDKLLTNAGDIYAFVFLHEGENDGETEYKIRIPVKARPQPSDTQPTPVEQSVIDQAIAALNAGIEEIESMAVVADTLAPGSTATANWEDGTLTLGIPRGDKGEQGIQGERGIQGPRGATGATGPKGDKGDTGIQGPKGDKGDTGPKGDKGDTGPQGVQGPKGNDGRQGTQGPPGNDGSDGVTPVRGVDYYTEADKAEIIDDISREFDLSSYVKKTDYAASDQAGVVKVYPDYGISLPNATKILSVNTADNSQIKAGSNQYRPIVPSNQHAAAFYGLARAAGDNTQSASSMSVGTYTANAKSAIRSMIGAVGTDNYASSSTGGVTKVGGHGVKMSDGTLQLYVASDSEVKEGSSLWRAIVAQNEHLATFYGLAKAAGDTTQVASDNEVGTYTDEAKTAIKEMLGVSGGGGGTSDYSDLTNKPSINNVTLSGNKSASDLGLATPNDIPDVSGFITQETDPTVPSWAKQSSKPTYTAQEVGALPNTTAIPTKVSDLTDDSGHYTKPAGGIPSADIADGVIPEVFIEKSASGTIASFPDGADSIPVKALTVDVEPVQDLHGYDNPWPGGGGTNLLNYADITNSSNVVSVTENNGVFTVVGSGSGAKINHLIPVTSGQTYVIHCVTSTNTEGNASQLSVCDVYDGNSASSTKLLDGASFGGSSSAKTFTPTGNSVYVSCHVTGGLGSGTGTITKPQIVKGSTKPTTYSPYSNICPITGWDEAVVTRTGVNVFDKDATDTDNGYVADKYVNGSGVLVSDSDCNISEYIAIKAEQTYTVYGVSGSNVGLAFYDRSKTLISALAYSITWGTIGSKTFTTPSNCSFIRFSIIKANVNITQLELGSTATPYEPYNGQTYVIDLDGTRYGGTLDVGTGVLTVDRAIIDLGDTENLSWHISNSTKFFYSSVTGMKTMLALTDPVILCSAYKAISPLSTNDMDNADNCTIAQRASNAQIMVKDTAYSTVESFVESVNGVKLVYPLATPTTVQLTAEEVTTLLGQNNIFADCGDVEVEYRSDGFVMSAVRTYISNSIPDWAKASTKPSYTASEVGAEPAAIVESVIDTDPSIVAQANHRYMCGTVTSIDFTPCQSGICDVIFTSGSTVAVLTIPNTVKFPPWFDPSSLETNTIYEINIVDGVYGAVMAWPA